MNANKFYQICNVNENYFPLCAQNNVNCILYDVNIFQQKFTYLLRKEEDN